MYTTFKFDSLDPGEYEWKVDNRSLVVVGKAEGTININKAPTRLNVQVSDISYGQNAIVTVSLESLNNNYFVPVSGTVDNKVTVTINGKDYNVKLVNGIGSVSIPGLNAGTYTATVKYIGDSYLQSSSASTDFTVNKIDPSLSVYVENVTYGKPSLITVRLSGFNDIPLNGNTIVTINNKEYTFEVISGVATRNDIYLEDSDIAYVYWAGNENYNSQTNQTSFNIGAARANMKVTVTDSNYGENNIIGVKLTGVDYAPLNGTVIVTINHKNYIVIVKNGSGATTISSLDAGNYNVGAIWFGDKHYEKTAAVTTFTVNKINPNLDILVNNTVYGVGSNIVIKLTGLNGEGLDGVVDVSVSGLSYSVIVKDGVGSVNTDVLAAGNYLVNANWNGSTNYNSQEKVTNFNIDKASSEVNSGILNSTYGEKLSLIINIYDKETLSPISGNALVIINGKSYTVFVPYEGLNVNLTDVVPAGVNYYEVTYAGNENYTGSSLKTSFNVDKATPLFDVNVKSSTFGEEVLLSIKMISNTTLEGISGDVILVLNGKTISIHVPEEGVVVNLTNFVSGGVNNYKITFNSDSNYNNASYEDYFILGQTTATLKLITLDGNYGEESIIGVELYGLEPISGTVSLTVNNKPYTVNVVNGKGVVKLGVLSAGTYNVVANWAGSSEYGALTNSTTFTVSPSSSYLNIIVSDTVYGEKATVTVKLIGNEPISGNVVVTIDGKSYTVNVVDGVGTVQVGSLEAGKYTATANYAGNTNYTSSTASFDFNVEKANPYLDILLSNNNSTSTDIFVNLKGINNSNLNGTVTVTINNNKYDITVTNGVGYKNIAPLADGTIATVKWAGDDNYNAQTNTTIYNGGSATSNLNISVTNVTFGNKNVITINLTNNAGIGLSGVVVVTINKVNYIVNVTNGSGSLDITLPVGNYTATAIYMGNNTYAKSSASTTFSVSKIDASLSIIATNVTYGTNTLITINVEGLNGQPLTGKAKVIIDDIVYEVYVVNGVGTLELGLDAGDYSNSKVIFDGTNNYNNKTQTFDFKVDPVSVIIISNFKVIGLHKGLITINLYELDAVTPVSGEVTVNINGKEYTLTVDSTGGFLVVENVLHGGSNYVNITYAGDDNHLETNKSGTFNVPLITPELDVKVSDAVYGETSTITVYLRNNFESLSGTVVVTIDGKKYNINVINGVGTGVTDVLDAGSYVATANYAGNENYTSKESSTTFIVNKKDSIVKVSVADIVYGESFTIIVSLFDSDLNDLSGNVIVVIAGKSYTVNVVDGSGSLTIADRLAGGFKLVTATYEGNDNYNKATAISNFNVAKANSTVDISIDDTSLGEDTIIKVSLTGINGEKLSGIVVVTIGNNKYTVLVIDGSGEKNIGKIRSGNYTATGIWLGNINYTASYDVCQIHVDVTTKLIIQDLTKYYGSDEKLLITLTVNGIGIPDKTITITINGVEYYRVTNKLGQVTLAVNLEPGVYSVSANYIDLLKADGTITILNTIQSNNLEKIYKQDSKFYATFLDTEGNNLVNTVVKFNINGVLYERLTDYKGVASLNINLDAGEYNITSYNPVTGEQKGNNVTILSTVKSTDLVKIYHSSDKFEAIFTDSIGNTLSNLAIEFNINGVIYNKITDKNGKASLNINLNSGDYIITVYNPVTGELISYNVRVLPSIDANNVTLYYHNGTQFTASFINSEGNVLSNQQVYFNINGVIYNRMTDANGVANLNINLNPGEYTITSYNPITGESIANQVVVKPVIIAKDVVKSIYEPGFYEVIVLNNQGKPLSGENVVININGVLYCKVSDEYGSVRIDINLPIGNYDATASWKDAFISNKIIVTA